MKKKKERGSFSTAIKCEMPGALPGVADRTCHNKGNPRIQETTTLNVKHVLPGKPDKTSDYDEIPRPTSYTQPEPHHNQPYQEKINPSKLTKSKKTHKH